MLKIAYRTCDPTGKLRNDADHNWNADMTITDVTPTLRIHIAAGVAIGPGKAELLEGIASTGSISKAAKQMGMGYRQAWAMVNSMNEQFIDPVVERTKGGADGGGTRLTEPGVEVLERYRAMEQKAINAISADAQAFEGLLKR